MADTPLTWDMTLPDGRKLAWDMKGAVWGGTVEQLLAAEQQNQTMNNPYNQISVTITDETVEQIVLKITELAALLGFCVEVPDAYRRGMHKLGPATAAYAAKGLGYMGTNPDYISPLFPMVEVNKDSTGNAQMDKFMPQLALLFHKAEGTQMLLGSDLLHAVDAYMKNAGEAAHRGQAEAEPIYKDLSDLYPGPGTRAKPVPAAKTTPTA